MIKNNTIATYTKSTKMLIREYGIRLLSYNSQEVRNILRILRGEQLTRISFQIALLNLELKNETDQAKIKRTIENYIGSSKVFVDEDNKSTISFTGMITEINKHTLSNITKILVSGALGIYVDQLEEFIKTDRKAYLHYVEKAINKLKVKGEK